MSNKKIENFSRAYDMYYSSVKAHISSNIKVLEIGGGAHPSISRRSNLSYTIIDPDQNELSKAPEDIKKISKRVESFEQEEKYDLIFSKMVLEHISDPDAFHKSVLKLLKPNGKVIHFFACRHSLPGFANRILPEKFGERILKILGNRNIEESPKYPAYYKNTKGGVSSQIKYFENLGYTIESYSSFVGHKYFQNIPILNLLEKLYTKLLMFFNLKYFATVALVVLKKRESVNESIK